MFQSINPFTGKVISSFEKHDSNDINRIVNESHVAQRKWRSYSFEQRSKPMTKFTELLREKKDSLSRLITAEMGKIISESQAEIDKCAWLCEYYAENAESMIEEKSMPSDGTISYVRFDPLGVIYAIMPWNFPFWQVLRFAIPTIIAGNTVVLKHAPNVFGCAQAIEQLLTDAGFPVNILRNLFIHVDLSEEVIAHPLIEGVTLTGSQKAGSIVAAQAGKYLKKTVLELGGSDPFIVLADADFSAACKTGVASRMLNSGQVCISAKRFIVEECIYNQFIEEQKALLESLRLGDPMDKNTDVGPMARPDLIDEIDRQVQVSVSRGAKLVTGGKKINTNFYAPTLLSQLQKGMPVYDEETFGPVSVVIPAKNAEDAVRIANDTSYGLGASVWTRDLELAEKMASELDAGAVFINGMTKSDPRLPFGGTKRSGYGRELSHFGIREFTNIKTIWIK